MIYEPREDSFLLQKYVKKLAYGNVLDIGTGFGILALEAAKKRNVEKVIALDIQKKVIEHCNKTIDNKKIQFFVSDLFSIFRTTIKKRLPKKINKNKKIENNKNPEKFDTIIFNPPYLPEDARLKDLTLDGGKKGYEILERFLNQVNSYLKEKGIALIVFSSLTKKEKVEEPIKRNLLDFETLDKKHIFFEDLYVYSIKKSKLLKKIENKGVKELSYFTHGHRGILFKGEYKKNKIVIKAKLPESKAVGRIKNEIKWLRELNKHDIGPKLRFYDNEFFAYEFIEGEFIIPYLKKSDKTKIRKTLKLIFRQLHMMDRLGVDKEEMHHPFKHIVIGKKAVLLDFERCHKTKKPKNVTQFMMCLIRKDMGSLLTEKGISLDKEKIIKIAKEYKRSYNHVFIEKIFEQ